MRRTERLLTVTEDECGFRKCHGEPDLVLHRRAVEDYLFDIPTVPVTEDAGTAAGTGLSNADQSTAAGETDENTGTDAQTGQEETESDSPQTETGTEETAETAETTSQTEETSSPDEIEIL